MKIVKLAVAVMVLGGTAAGVALAEFGWYSESEAMTSRWSDPFLFDVAIEENSLRVTFTNTSDQAIRIESHVATGGEKHYDNLTLLVISPDMETNQFGFVNSRDRSVAVYEVIEAGESSELSIDLVAWNENGANSFHFEDDTEYIVVATYKWSPRSPQPPDGKQIRLNYTSDALKISFSDGEVRQLL